MSSELPFIDEFETQVEAPAQEVFLSTARLLGRSFGGAGGRVFTALLGCAHRGDSYTVPPVAGQETNGFRVARVDSPRELILEGRHRFAAYRLSFFVDAVDEGHSRLRARTDAAFPGFLGAVYRALVIGSGAHALIAKRMLSAAGRVASRRTVA